VRRQNVIKADRHVSKTDNYLYLAFVQLSEYILATRLLFDVTPLMIDWCQKTADRLTETLSSRHNIRLAN